MSGCSLRAIFPLPSPQTTPPSQHGCDCSALANSILPRRNGSWLPAANRAAPSPRDQSCDLPWLLFHLASGCGPASSTPPSLLHTVTVCSTYVNDTAPSRPAFRQPYASIRHPYGNIPHSGRVCMDASHDPCCPNTCRCHPPLGMPLSVSTVIPSDS